jgi:hypothetical protein
VTVEEWAALAAWVAAAVSIASTGVTLWLQWWRRTQRPPGISPGTPEWDAAIAATVAAAPPLTERQKARITALLWPRQLPHRVPPAVE